MKAHSIQLSNILLAEDDSDDRLFLQEAVEFLNLDTEVNISTVKDGEELMKTLLKPHTALPDILFLDLNIPRKNGMECLDEIRSNKKLKAMVVVIFTTSTNPKDVEEAFDKGANIYIRKPRKFSDLTNMIRKIYHMDSETLQQGEGKENFVWIN